jgi:hypothetical protein
MVKANWAERLQAYNAGRKEKTASETDREANVEFLRLLQEEQDQEQSRDTSFQVIPKFF